MSWYDLAFIHGPLPSQQLRPACCLPHVYGARGRLFQQVHWGLIVCHIAIL